MIAFQVVLGSRAKTNLDYDASEQPDSFVVPPPPPLPTIKNNTEVSLVRTLSPQTSTATYSVQEINTKPTLCPPYSLMQGLKSPCRKEYMSELKQE